MRSRYFFSIFVFALFFCVSSSTALPSENSTAQQDTSSKAYALHCLNTSLGIIDELSHDGFNIRRVNDSIRIAQQLFDSQLLAEARERKSDYSSVAQACSQIEALRTSAYQAKDSVFSLENTYASFSEKVSLYGTNISEVQVLMDKVRKDMSDERYEEVIKEIPVVEQKMTEVEATATTLNIFYKTATRGIKEFFLDHLTQIIVFFVLVFVFYGIYHLRLRRYLALRNIEKLEREKKVLQDLIKDTQYTYFHKGTMSQEIYSIKTNKYAELIRDIERQIPLLREEVAKVDVRLNKNRSEKKKKMKKHHHR